MKLKVNEEFTKVAEGKSLKLYKCPAGKLTIGYGRNLEDNGITNEEAELMFRTDFINVANVIESSYKFIANDSPTWQTIFADMLYNLGPTKFAKMKKFISALKLHDHSEALLEMVDSAWFKQVGNRSKLLFIAGQTGDLPEIVQRLCKGNQGMLNVKFKLAFSIWLNQANSDKARFLERSRVSSMAKSLDLL